MNEIQRLILVATAVVILLMMMFPPWTFARGTIKENMGYSFVFEPPVGLEQEGGYPLRKTGKVFYASVNTSQLYAQIIGVLVAGGVGCLAFKGFVVKIPLKSPPVVPRVKT